MGPSMDDLLVELSEVGRVSVRSVPDGFLADLDVDEGSPISAMGDKPHPAVRRLWLQVFGTRTEVAG